MRPQRRPLKIDVQLRTQVVSLRRTGHTVSEIGERLGLIRAADFEAIRWICDSLPRMYGFGEVAPRAPLARTRGGRK